MSTPTLSKQILAGEHTLDRINLADAVAALERELAALRPLQPENARLFGELAELRSKLAGMEHAITDTNVVIEQVSSENAELKRCRTIADEHLRADTERLDWLSVVRAGSWYPFQNGQGEWWIVHRDAKLSVGPEPTLRAAIDAARGKP